MGLTSAAVVCATAWLLGASPVWHAGWAQPRREVADATRFAARQAAPVWTTADGGWTGVAQRVIERLRQSDREGLDPAVYLPVSAEPPATARADRETALTVAVLRYMHDLHLGRIDPRGLGLDLAAWAEPHDFAAVLREGLASGRLDEALDGLAPPFPVYRALIDQLARYRALAAARWPALPSPGVSVKPGHSYAGLAALRARLRDLGDLAPGTDAGGGTPAVLDAETSAALVPASSTAGVTSPASVPGARSPRSRSRARNAARPAYE